MQLTHTMVDHAVSLLRHRIHLSKAEISRRTGVPVQIIRGLELGRYPKIVEHGPLYDFIKNEKPKISLETCDEKAPFIPSPEHIKLESSKINQAWSESERMRRLRRMNTSFLSLTNAVLSKDEIDNLTELDSIYA